MSNNYAEIRARQNREADKAAYDRGRADERAAIVAWLRDRWYVAAAETARQIERGEHEEDRP